MLEALEAGDGEVRNVKPYGRTRRAFLSLPNLDKEVRKTWTRYL